MTNPTATQPDLVEKINQRGVANLPGYLGIVVTELDSTNCKVSAELAVRQELIAPNGFMYAGSVVTLADTCAAYGCLAALPPGASGFTTLELKSNFLGTARDGTVECSAAAVHKGRTTQVWDAVVKHRESGKTIALFRCTQMILYPQ